MPQADCEFYRAKRRTLELATARFHPGAETNSTHDETPIVGPSWRRRWGAAARLVGPTCRARAVAAHRGLCAPWKQRRGGRSAAGSGAGGRAAAFADFR